MAEDRAQRAANNKSLRIIKNELEALAERGFISDDQYDNIVSTLPAESSLSRPTPSATPSHTLDAGLAALSVGDTAHRSVSPAHRSVSPAPPPSYQAAAQPPPAAQQHKEVAHAVALWRYATPDARDLNLEPGDHISVTEFVNAEWWLGKNARTAEEGIFPSNYVRRENYPSPLVAQGQQPQSSYYGDQKYNPPQHQHQQQRQQQQQQYHQPQQQYQQPGPANPYANPAPPMAIAAQQPGGEPAPGEEKENKGMEMGKKIGGKLGNAAIFGAGATLGGNLVNSIF